MNITPLLRRNPSGGFTLIETLVSATFFIAILGLLAGITGSTFRIWTGQRSRAAAFEGANAVFDNLTRTLAQSTLNTYWSYDNPMAPARYIRRSELHFFLNPAVPVLNSDAALFPGSAVFFQAPLGRTTEASLTRLTSLLNSVGYFVCYSEATSVPPFLKSIVPKRERYRLYEWLQPAEELALYNGAAKAAAESQREWFLENILHPDRKKNAAVLAENVIGLILMAEYPKASPDTGFELTYAYDSRSATSSAMQHQLPPKIKVLMVVIDEPSAIQLAEKYGDTPPPITPETGWFSDPAKYQHDLEEWEKKLKAAKPTVNYRIYTATVDLFSAKWSL